VSEELKPCPCGNVPDELHVIDTGQGSKWAMCFGSCCNEWSIEFKTQYHDFSSQECMELAIEAWNAAPRANKPTEE